MEIRTGLGYDIHRLAAGRKLVLGGVDIPFEKGLAGHSDADCLVHAIIDALLGAAGEPDIGRLFPDDDERLAGARSIDLLTAVMSRLVAAGWKVGNVDSIISAERPKLAPYIERMKAVVAPVLGLDGSRLGIKAKTGEGLGPVGAGDAVACWASVLLIK